jgi:hypothetical protein
MMEDWEGGCTLEGAGASGGGRGLSGGSDPSELLPSLPLEAPEDEEGGVEFSSPAGSKRTLSPCLDASSTCATEGFEVLELDSRAFFVFNHLGYSKLGDGVARTVIEELNDLVCVEDALEATLGRVGKTAAKKRSLRRQQDRVNQGTTVRLRQVATEFMKRGVHNAELDEPVVELHTYYGRLRVVGSPVSVKNLESTPARIGPALLNNLDACAVALLCIDLTYTPSDENPWRASAISCRARARLEVLFSRSSICVPSKPSMTEIHDSFDTILILDFGSQVR